MTGKYTVSKILGMILITATALLLWSCSTFPENELYIYGNSSSRPSSDNERVSGIYRDKVFILYSMGYNNLSGDLNKNIDELLTGNVPSFRYEDNAILILSHSTHNNAYDYSTPTSPALYHAYVGNDGRLTRDTLAVFPLGSVAATKEIFSETLEIIKERFPAKEYGMLISSHSTGWAPEMYCTNPPDKSYGGGWGSMRRNMALSDIYCNERPLTKSIGAHFKNSTSDIDEIDLKDFAEAIPFHLDYLIFDCCLMGGIEVAYELRNKCDKICFSQTEILSEGMNYLTMISHIFDSAETNIEGIAYDYYTRYAVKNDPYYKSATISVVDCRKLDAVAEVIKRNHSAINVLASSNNRSKVQRYYRSSLAIYHGIFYDIEDIMIQANVPESEREDLRNALKECVICKYATPTFLSSLKIENHSGLSMYLIDTERTILNKYYTTLEWNKATELIAEFE